MLKIGAVIAVIGAAGVARAITVRPPTFEDLVDGATQVLRVEITEASSRWDDADGRKVIHTYVTAKVLRVLKGEAGSTVVLRFFGGRVGKTQMRVPDMPALEVGRRYIVFVKNNGQAFCPLLAANHGNYALVRDGTTGIEHVMRSDGGPLRGVQGVSRPMGKENGGISAQATLTAAMTRDEFEKSILSELARIRP